MLETGQNKVLAMKDSFVTSTGSVKVSETLDPGIIKYYLSYHSNLSLIILYL